MSVSALSLPGTLFRSKIDGFVPRCQRVNLRIVLNQLPVFDVSDLFRFRALLARFSSKVVEFVPHTDRGNLQIGLNKFLDLDVSDLARFHALPSRIYSNVDGFVP